MPDPGMSFAARRIAVLAPNWLGDAVMALPAVADVRRAYPDSVLTVAARGAVAGLFGLLPWVDGVAEPRAAALRGFDVAILLPNSFRSAWTAARAGVPERWGYATDLRGRLLTRAIPRTRGGHQAAYYQRLTTALGIPPGDSVPRIDVPDDVMREARDLLAEHGHPAGSRLVAFAPGAAYGTAKQWIPAYVADVVAALARRADGDAARATAVVLGSRADTPALAAVRAALPAGTPVVDLVGRTSLRVLAGVLAAADVCVCNDSGAMHLAAAVGTAVVATFGPTNEAATAPLPRPGRTAQVLTHEVWCRPCMLRECPIDHRCMRGITPARVEAAVLSALAR